MGRRRSIETESPEQIELRDLSRQFVLTLAQGLHLGSGVNSLTADAQLAYHLRFALEQTIGDEISFRTILRWCQGGPIPTPKKLDKLLEDLGVKGEAARKVHEAANRFRVKKVEHSSSSSDREPSRLLGLDARAIDAFLLIAYERELNRRRRCDLLPIGAHIESKYGSKSGEAYFVEWTDDVVKRMQSLVTEHVPFPIRLYVQSVRGAGKFLAINDLRSKLLQSYQHFEVVEPGIRNRPFPIVVAWKAWLTKLKEHLDDHHRNGISGDEKVELPRLFAKSLLECSDQTISTRVDAEEFRRSRVLVIIRDVPEDGFKDVAFGAYQAHFTGFIAGIGRLVVTGENLRGVGEQLDGIGIAALKHDVRISTLDVREVAERCRLEFGRSNPKHYSDLGRLGDDLTITSVPGIAGVALSRIRCGKLPIGCLSSDTLLLVALYMADLDERNEIVQIRMAATTSVAVEEAASTRSFADPDHYGRLRALGRLDRESDVKSKGDYRNEQEVELERKRREYELERKVLDTYLKLDKRGAAFRLSSKSQLVDSGGNWLFDELKNAHEFVHQCLEIPRSLEAFPSVSADTEEQRPGENQPDEEPRKRLMKLMSPLFRIDPGATRFLIETFSIPLVESIVKENDPDIAGVLADLDQAKKWNDISARWASFVAWLPLVNDDGRARRQSKFRNDICERLLKLFYKERDDDPGQTTFRWHGAKAAALLFSEEELAGKLKTVTARLIGDQWLDQEPGAAENEVRPLLFYGEVIANLVPNFGVPRKGREAHDFGANGHVGGQGELAKELYETLSNLADFELKQTPYSASIRHARYHLWEALARIGPPETTREYFSRLFEKYEFENYFRDPPIVVEPFRAVECGTALGVLAKFGLPESFCFKHTKILGLMLATYKEVKDPKFWRKDPPSYQTLAHMFPVFRHLSPLLPISKRSEILNEDAGIVYAENSDDWTTETGTITWMLNWVEQEMRDGVMLDRNGGIVKFFMQLREKLEKLDPPNHDRLERIIKISQGVQNS